ncbi:BREX-1 system phosphatase PglZ type A [Nitratiruptor sp. SB155-2]|uniref:BREX-1 system phosphatase PglZ type A n=1 Tax=Nitratiruptor sp. (strain SB155-2) TaxID=387092 RepID=UPI0001587341|nr:BREX-1 system phosphatase PglZ type A [Nitratiruptor sp. SB155-2]BAF69861.1 conserved hypothetical protein [Nitratiruptor sp. SB155-2]
MDIESRLKELFNEQKIIFWYDENGELKDEFENIEIDGVKKLEIDQNEFGIKVEVLTNKKQKYLIYSPYPAPKDEDNWLLDLNLANYIFRADRASLILDTLGLDLEFKEFIKEHLKFFNSKKRMQELKAKLEKENKESLIIKMASILLKSDETMESVLLKIFEKGSDELEKFGLDREIFEIASKKFGFEIKSVDDLLYKLFENYFAYNVYGKSHYKVDARVFLKQWMENIKYQNLFKQISQKIAKDLHIVNELEKLAIEQKSRCEVYEECEQEIIKWILGSLVAKENLKEILELIKSREDKIWFKEYENIYKALFFAAKLFDTQSRYSFSSFKNAINEYASIHYKADLYYRKYHYFREKSEKVELLKVLDEEIENFYLNAVLREANDQFDKFVKEYKVDEEHQQNFFKKFVKPYIDSNKKLFVIISDALRYEAAKELENIINKMDKFESETSYLISSLPSYTQLGMAALLPHKKLSQEDSDLVLVDDKNSSGIVNRDKILKSYSESFSAIWYEDYLKLDREKGRELTKNNSLIYIYHDEIDKTGEKDETNTFNAVQSTFDTLIKLIKQINNFNGYNILIVSDHGFLSTKSPTKASEFCPKPEGDIIRLNRRFVIGKNFTNKSCTHSFNANELGIESDNSYLIAKSINKIRVQGGGNRYVHGGATLQEIVIPVIKIRKKRVSDVRDVEVDILPISTISTNIVNITLYQKEPISEKVRPVTLKIAFELDGEILSDVQTVTFDKSDEYSENREVKVPLTFKGEIKNYNNKTIKLVARKVKENSSVEPIYKELDVKVSIAFFNEFDEF